MVWVERAYVYIYPSAHVYISAHICINARRSTSVKPVRVRKRVCSSDICQGVRAPVTQYLLRAYVYVPFCVCVGARGALQCAGMLVRVEPCKGV